MVEALYVRQLLIAMFEQVMQPGAAENTLKMLYFRDLRYYGRNYTTVQPYVTVLEVKTSQLKILSRSILSLLDPDLRS